MSFSSILSSFKASALAHLVVVLWLLPIQSGILLEEVFRVVTELGPPDL
jgi:hypothetical protein